MNDIFLCFSQIRKGSFLFPEKEERNEYLGLLLLILFTKLIYLRWGGFPPCLPQIFRFFFFEAWDSLLKTLQLIPPWRLLVHNKRSYRSLAAEEARVGTLLMNQAPHYTLFILKGNILHINRQFKIITGFNLF